MCLTNVEERWPDGTNQWTEAWKVFVVYDGSPYFLFYGLAGSLTPPIGRWLTAEGSAVRYSHHRHYPSGFHVFPTRKAAAGYASGLGSLASSVKIIKVRIRRVTAKGDQDGFPALVAQQMLIPRVARKKPAKPQPKTKTKPRRTK